MEWAITLDTSDGILFLTKGRGGGGGEASETESVDARLGTEASVIWGRDHKPGGAGGL